MFTSSMPQLAFKSPPLGLHSPPDSNALKDGSDSELSDLEMDLDPSSNSELHLEPKEIIDGVPVFAPSMEQFQDFEKFITAVNPWGMTHGIVKVIPPKKWLDEQPSLHEEVKKIKIKNPYIQEMNNQGSRGTTGNFRQLNLSSNRTYNIVEWRALCNQLSRQPPAKRGETRRAPEKLVNAAKKKVEFGRPCENSESTVGRMSKPSLGKKSKSKPKEEEVSVNSRRNKYREDDTLVDEKAFKDFDYNLYEEFDDERCQELEVAYWKHISYAPPIYGGDMPGTLFTDKTKVWDLRNLPGFLNYLDEKVPGINTTYLYIGSWKSTFSWHLEDVDLYSINYLHFGAPKQWYSISQGDRERFEKAMAIKWPEEYKDCNQFLRHKTFQISPAALLKEFKIKVNKIVHRPGEFMITFPYGYHAGYNLGYNCAEAVNFAVDEWIPIAEKAKRCDCAQQQDSVWVDLDSLRKKLPRTHKWYLGEPGEEEYFEEDEIDQPTDMPTPPHSGSDIKICQPRKRKHITPKTQIRPPKRRATVKVPEEPDCILCPNAGFEILSTDNGKKAHRICGEYIPETCVVEDVVHDIGFISKARMGLKCINCRSKKGACFQCSAAKCTRAYHATCAAASGVLVQKVWISSYVEDGTEYKEEIFDFRCRFHRPRRDKDIDEVTLSEDCKIKQFGYGLEKGDVCQFQYLRSEIFAGLVISNNRSESSVTINVLFDKTNTSIEIDYRWLLVPPLEQTLQKPSSGAIPMPKSFKAKESLNTKARQFDDVPMTRDSFVENFTWAEYKIHDLDPNPEQIPIDLSKENQIWYYLGKTSTEAKAQFTEDITKPRDNPKGHFLTTVSKPSPARTKSSHNSSRSSKSSGHLASNLLRSLTKSNLERADKIKTQQNKLASKPHQRTKALPDITLSSHKRPPKLTSDRRATATSIKNNRKKLSSFPTPNSGQKHLKNQGPKNKSITQPNGLNSLPPLSRKSQPSLLLTQPNWPSLNPKVPNSVKTFDKNRSSPVPCSAPNGDQQQILRQIKPRPSGTRPLNDTDEPVVLPANSYKPTSILSPFMKYKYLQIEHNKDVRSYKSPYRIGGGFSNGYERTKSSLKNQYSKTEINNMKLSSNYPVTAPFAGKREILESTVRRNYNPYQDPRYSNMSNSNRNRGFKNYDNQSLPNKSPSNAHNPNAAKQPQLSKSILSMNIEPAAKGPSHSPYVRITNRSNSVAAILNDEPKRNSHSSRCDISYPNNQLKVSSPQARIENSYEDRRNVPDSKCRKSWQDICLNENPIEIPGLGQLTNNTMGRQHSSRHPQAHDQIKSESYLKSNNDIIQKEQKIKFPLPSASGFLRQNFQNSLLCNNEPNFPDVPPDISTLIERMMNNLKKASNHNNGMH